MNKRLDGIVATAQQKFEQRGGTANSKKRVRELVRSQWTRSIVRADRFDMVEWHGNQDEQHAWFTSTPVVGVRSDPEVDAAINDLFYGDLKNPDDRPGYLNGPELLADIFQTFFQASPKLHKKAEVIKDARLNGKFVEQLMELPAFEEIRDYTIGDAETAKGAMLALVDVIKEMIKQHREAVQEANEQRQQDGCDPGGQPGNSNNKESWDEETPGQQGTSADGSGSSGDSAGEKDGKSQYGESDGRSDGQQDWDHHEEDGDGSPEGEGPSPSDPTDTEDGGERDEAGSDQVRDGDGDFNDALDGEYETESNWEQIADQINFGQYANAPLSEKAEELADLQDAMKGVGLTPGEWKLMDPARRLKIAEQLGTKRMKKIADLCGRMTRFAQTKQAQKVIDSPHEIYTIEQGNDLTRTVRSEFGLLGHADTKLWWYMKYANGELLQYKKRGHEDVGKGPIIICIDNSGSMSGSPEEWAKGVAEALRRIAADQDRDYYAMYFETNRHRERFSFPRGKGPFEKVMAFLSVSAGGGTEFDGVLEEALQKAIHGIEGQARDSKGKADIVMVTDGAAYLDKGWIDNFNAKRREHGVRVMSVYISAYDSERSSAMKLLESFSDTAMNVNALTVDDESTSFIFSTL